MNLVAKEYCAAHNDESGVLILSEFAGSAYQFQEQAMLVNPFDANSIATAMKKSIDLDPSEKQERMRKLRENIRRYDIYWWVDEFLKAGKRQEGGRKNDRSSSAVNAV